MDPKSRKGGLIASFSQKHPIIINLLLMVAIFSAFVWGTFMLIDIFTEHGRVVKVPNILNKPLDQAIASLEAGDFTYEISDSVWREDMRPGIVLDQDPKPGSNVKSTRTIYLIINAFYPKSVNLPPLNDISIRQAMSMVKSLGFKNITVDTIPSPYEGLVLKVLVNGKQVKPGGSVTINSHINITVGDGKQNDVPLEVLPKSTLDSLQKIEEAKARREAQRRAAQQAQQQEEEQQVTEEQN